MGDVVGEVSVEVHGRSSTQGVPHNYHGLFMCDRNLSLSGGRCVRGETAEERHTGTGLVKW